MDAMTTAIQKIDEIFEIESLIIKHEGWIQAYGIFGGIWVEPGTYPVGRNKRIYNNSKLIEASPLVAHYLNRNGMADLLYKNGELVVGKHFAKENA